MNNPQVKSLVSQFVHWYAETRDGLLVLDYDAIPESDLNKLCALMIAHNDDLAAESCGPDNPAWEKSMKPALIESMKDDYFSLIDFPDIWKAGVRSYLKSHICTMITERLEFLNEGMECHTSLIWDRKTEKTIEINSHG